MNIRHDIRMCFDHKITDDPPLQPKRDVTVYLMSIGQLYTYGAEPAQNQHWLNISKLLRTILHIPRMRMYNVGSCGPLFSKRLTEILCM